MRTSSFEFFVNLHGHFIHASDHKTHILDQITMNLPQILVGSGKQEKPMGNYEQCKSWTGVMVYDNGNVPSNSCQCTKLSTENIIDSKTPYVRANSESANVQLVSGIMLNSMRQRNTSVNSVQNQSNHKNKITRRRSSTIKTTLIESTSSPANSYQFTTMSESNRLECTDDKLSQSHSTSSTNAVNCSIYKYRGKSNATGKWSTTMHNIHALFMCFAILALVMRNTLVSANTVAATMTLATSESSIIEPVQPINMTAIIRNQISINGISTSENITNPRRAGGSK